MVFTDILTKSSGKGRNSCLMFTPTAETHLSDRFEASVRYDQLIEEVERISNRTKFRTLEALGETIARGLIKRFDRITSNVVVVSKASPPISQPIEIGRNSARPIRHTAAAAFG
jgi:dihydroneopterin aldolase